VVAVEAEVIQELPLDQLVLEVQVLLELVGVMEELVLLADQQRVELQA